MHYFDENKIAITIIIAALIISGSIYLSKLAPAIGIAGIIVGWLLYSLTDLAKGKFKKNRLLKSLFVELQFNEGLVSYRYLYFADLFKDDSALATFPKEEREKFLSSIINITLRKELAWGFKTSAYNKAELEGVLIDLPSYGEIMEIYRIISVLQDYGVPKDKAGWLEVRRKLEELRKSLKLVTENFYKNKKEWIKIIHQELQKK